MLGLGEEGGWQTSVSGLEGMVDTGIGVCCCRCLFWGFDGEGEVEAGREGGELYPGPEILNHNPFSLSRLVYVLRHWANYFLIFDFWGFSGHAPFGKSLYLCVFDSFGYPPP